MIETCRKCGTTWGVTTEPRAEVLCSACATTPRAPEGEVRRDRNGILAVCLGGDRDLRWKLIGPDPHLMNGWRADRHMTEWTRVGNVHDLPATGGKA